MNDRDHKRRKDRGPRWTKRDRLFLVLTGEQFATRFDQAQRFYGGLSKAKLLVPGLLSESSTRQLIDRYVEEKLMLCKKILHDEPKYCWLSRAGYREAGLPFGFVIPKDLEHIYWGTQVRLWCAKNHPTYSWQSERWIRHEGNVFDTKFPDAILTAPDGSRVCVEIEREQKNSVKLAGHLQARTMVFERVWYFSPPDVAKAVTKAQQDLEKMYAERVTIIDLDSL